MNETIVKHLNFGEDAKNKIFQGIEKLTKAVSSTLGANGKCVILEDSKGDPQITKDGVTVANDIILLDPVENMGSKLLKEAARKTVKEAGDGTTTATVLAHAILKEAYGAIKSENSRELKIGIHDAVDKVIAYLEKISKPVTGDRITQVATISSNNDSELGELIGEAFKSVDETGVVRMQTHEDPSTIIESIEGVQYEKGFVNQHFITDSTTGTAELENPLILIVNSKIENIRKIQSVLEHAITNKESLLIIGDVEHEVIGALAMNKVKGNIKINVVEAPIFGVSRKETLDDLAALTGATVIDETLGDDMDLIQSLKDRIKKEKNVNFIKRLEKRVSMLSAKLAVVKVGANSEIELKEKRDRVEDAICATRAAIKEGIVPGGGVALLNAANNIKAKSTGEQILLNAVCAPYSTILRNAGMVEISLPEGNGRGLDVVTGKAVNMVKAGIIDPLLVTKSALKNAASVATTILSTDCVINNLRIDESNR